MRLPLVKVAIGGSVSCKWVAPKACDDTIGIGVAALSNHKKTSGFRRKGGARRSLRSWLAEENTVGVDSFGVAAITRALTDCSIVQERIVGISQGWKLNGAIKDTERDLAGGIIIHPGQNS